MNRRAFPGLPLPLLAWLRALSLQSGTGVFAGTGGFAGSAGFPTGWIVANNGDLVIPGVQSPNFENLVQGWQILKNGNAQFNNVTITGTFNGTDFVLNSSGMFFYSGIPANGNLIVSIATFGDVDQYGNTYLGGITSYTGSAIAEIFEGSLFLGLTLEQITSQVPGGISIIENNGESSLQIMSGLLATSGYTSSILLQANNDVGETNPSQVNLNAGTVVIGANGVTYWNDNTAEMGLPAGAGPLCDTWHAVTPPSGWSGVNRYKLLPWNMVVVEVQLSASSTTGNITCMTLPSGYCPASDISLPLAITSTDALPKTLRMTINTVGVVQTSALTATTNICGCWTFPNN